VQRVFTVEQCFRTKSYEAVTQTRQVQFTDAAPNNGFTVCKVYTNTLTLVELCLEQSDGRIKNMLQNHNMYYKVRSLIKLYAVPGFRLELRDSAAKICKALSDTIDVSLHKANKFTLPSSSCLAPEVTIGCSKSIM
jgi:hypothetical protein